MALSKTPTTKPAPPAEKSREATVGFRVWVQGLGLGFQDSGFGVSGFGV